MDLLYTVWKEQRLDTRSGRRLNDFEIRKSIVSGDGGWIERLTYRFMSDPGGGVPRDGRGLRGGTVRKDSEPRCDEKLDEDCRRRTTTNDGEGQ
jgi:hypothetical protein